MPITLLDGIVIAFTLVSALLAMVRGFSREVLSIVTWVAAAAAAYFFYKPVLPFVEPHVDNPKIAIAVAAGIVFLIALIVVTVITMKIADFIIDSRVGALDRALGFIYGAARGILVCAVAMMFFNWLAGTKAPDWVANAKTKPMLDSVGTWIESKLPEDPESLIPKDVLPGADNPADATAPAEGQDAPADAGGANDNDAPADDGGNTAHPDAPAN